jgi:preprotein translocase subunit YajC
LFLIAIFALMWALLIRPQKAKQRAQQQMLSQIDPGDEILTVGGIYGIVVEEDEDEDLVVEIADGIHVRIARRAVATVVKPDDEDDEAVEADEEAEDGEDAVVAESDAAGDERAEEGLVTVPDDEASVEATQRRLFRRR